MKVDRSDQQLCITSSIDVVTWFHTTSDKLAGFFSDDDVLLPTFLPWQHSSTRLCKVTMRMNISRKASFCILLPSLRRQRHRGHCWAHQPSQNGVRQPV